jgi:multidrug efflux system outer membrane protein
VVNRVEVTRAQLALVRAQQAEKEAVQVEAQSYRTLATLIPLPLPFRVAPAEPRAVAATPARVDELADQALKLRPDFPVLERSIDVAAAQVRAAKWRWAPTLSGFGQARTFNYSGFSGDNYAWLVGVQLDWILYDGGSRDAARELAWAQKREYQARLDLLHDTVRDEVANAVDIVEVRRQALETARQSVALARDTLELVRVQHDAGTAAQLDLLAAQDSLVIAEVSLAQARFDLQLADLSLERSVGTFPSPRSRP